MKYWRSTLTATIRGARFHVTDQQLLLALDGELTERERRSVQRHLESCWGCRTRSEKIQATIRAMVHCQSASLDARVKDDKDGGRALLAVHLQELARQLAVKSAGHGGLGAWWEGLRRWAQPMILVPAGSLVVVAATVAFVAVHPQPQKGVDSRALLADAAHIEEASLHIPNTVTHQTLLLEQRDAKSHLLVERRQIEVWRLGTDRQARRVYRDAHQLTAGEWVRPGKARVVYERPDRGAVKSEPMARPLWEMSPSAVDFVAMAKHSERVIMTSSPVLYTFRYEEAVQGDRPRLLRASLDVRRSDMRPTRESIHTEGASGDWDYSVSETASETLRAQDVAAQVFDVDPDVALIATAPELAEVPAPLEIPATLEKTVEVLGVLDGAGALLNQEVRMTKTDRGALVVKGVVQDEERKQALLRLLDSERDDPSVHLSILSVADGPHVAETRAARVQVVEGSGDSPAWGLLNRYLAATKHLEGEPLNQAALQLSNEAITSAGDAQAQVHALQEIFSNVAETRLPAMSQQDRREWKALVHAHTVALQGDLMQLEQSIAPLTGNASTEGVQPHDAESMSSSCQRLQEATEQIEQAIHQSFAVSTDQKGSAAIETAQFWRGLHIARRAANTIAERTSP